MRKISGWLVFVSYLCAYLPVVIFGGLSSVLVEGTSEDVDFVLHVFRDVHSVIILHIRLRLFLVIIAPAPATLFFRSIVVITFSIIVVIIVISSVIIPETVFPKPFGGQKRVPFDLFQYAPLFHWKLNFSYQFFPEDLFVQSTGTLWRHYEKSQS